MITRAILARSRLAIALLALLTALAPIPMAGVTAASAQSCTPLVGMDAPADGSTLSGPVSLTGWAVDAQTPAGSGVDEVSIYRDGSPDDGGTFLADATLGDDRPDIDSANGLTASGAGWTASVDFTDTAAGSYDIYVMAHTMCGWTSSVQTVAVDASPAPVAAAPVPLVSAPPAPPQPPAARVQAPPAPSTLANSYAATPANAPVPSPSPVAVASAPAAAPASDGCSTSPSASNGTGPFQVPARSCAAGSNGASTAGASSGGYNSGMNGGGGYPSGHNGSGGGNPYSGNGFSGGSPYGGGAPYGSASGYGYGSPYGGGSPYGDPSGYGSPYGASGYGSPYGSSPYGAGSPYGSPYGSASPYGYGSTNPYGSPYGYSDPYASMYGYSSPYGSSYPYGYPYGTTTASAYQQTVTVTATTGSAVLSWTPISTAMTYRVYQSQSSSTLAYGLVQTAAQGTSSATVANLTPGLTYSFQVRAVDAYGTETPVVAYGTAGTGTSASLVSPTGLVVTGSTNSTVALSWIATSNAASYRVFQSLNGSAYTSSVMSMSGVTSATVYDLAPNVTYSFQVIALDYYGNQSAPSSTVSATTSTALAGLTAPSGLTVLGVSNTTANLGWNAASGAASYRVYQSTPAGVITQAAFTMTSATTAVVSGLTPGTPYSFAVIAVDAMGNISPPSTAASVTTPNLATARL